MQKNKIITTMQFGNFTIQFGNRTPHHLQPKQPSNRFTAQFNYQISQFVNLKPLQ